MVPLLILFININQIYEVEGVVVYAPRYPVLLKDISAGVTIIDKEVIDAQGSSNVGELLKNLAGIDIKDYGSPGTVASISIRGMPSSGVLVLLNGIPLNSVQTGIADISFIDVNDIERIEIIKAPVSSLYGANGIGGIVNIITEDGLESEIASASVKHKIGSVVKRFNASEYFVKYKIPYEHFNYKITGKQTSSRGGRTNNDCDGFSLKNQIGYESSALKINLNTILNVRDYGIPGPQPRIDSLNSLPYLGDSTSTSKYDNQFDRIWLNNLLLTLQPLNNLSFNSSLFGNLQNNRYHTRYFGWGIVDEDYQYSLTTLGINNSLMWEWKQDKLIFGFDYRYDTLKAEKKSVQTGDTIWSAQAKNYGYWCSLVKKILKLFTINGSVRYDNNSSYGEFLSPSFGIISEINQRLWLKFSIARAFRAPGFNDLYWPIYGNRELKPEYGNAYELRIESSPVYNLFAGFSLFLRDIKDRITWLPTKDGLWKPQNVNYLRIAGTEAELHLKLTNNLKITFDGTYLFARQKNQELIYYDFITSEMEFQEIEREGAFIPPLTFSIKIDHKIKKDLFLNFNTEYTSRRFNYYENWNNLPEITMDTKELKLYYLVNVHLRKKIFENLILSLSIKNLFDTHYGVQFGNGLNDRDYPMPGRTFIAGISWN